MNWYWKIGDWIRTFVEVKNLDKSTTMKNTCILLLLNLLFFGLTAQPVIKAPADVVVSCKLGQELDENALKQLDHPIYGSIHNDSTLVEPITTQDIVCEQMCMEDARIEYDSSQSAFHLACDYYQTLFNGDFAQTYSLNWGGRRFH